MVNEDNMLFFVPGSLFQVASILRHFFSNRVCGLNQGVSPCCILFHPEKHTTNSLSKVRDMYPKSWIWVTKKTQFSNMATSSNWINIWTSQDHNNATHQPASSYVSRNHASSFSYQLTPRRRTTALPWIFQLQQIELSEMTNTIISFNVVGEDVLCCLAVSFSIETSQTFGFT